MILDSRQKRSDGSQAAMLVFAIIIALLSGILLSTTCFNWWQGIISTMIVLLSLMWLGEF